jgi:hypothetical protein
MRAPFSGRAIERLRGQFWFCSAALAHCSRADRAREGSHFHGGGRLVVAQVEGPPCRFETCPVSTEGRTRRVHFVREGGRGGGQVEGPPCTQRRSADEAGRSGAGRGAQRWGLAREGAKELQRPRGRDLAWQRPPRRRQQRGADVVHVHAGHKLGGRAAAPSPLGVGGAWRGAAHGVEGGAEGAIDAGEAEDMRGHARCEGEPRPLGLHPRLPAGAHLETKHYARTT